MKEKMTNHSDTLRRKIETHQAQVGVVGLGYVGLPLVVEFAQAGFTDLALVQIGGDQQHDFLNFAEKELLPALQES